MENLTPVFIALTGIAVLLQAGVLIAIFVVLRKTSTKMEALATEVKTKVLPTIAQAEAMMTQIRPKVEAITEQVQESTTLVRNEIERVDATVNDVVDRARLQIIRADELFTRTLDRVERTSEIVHKTVISPVRQVSGLMQGLTAGLEFLFAHRGRRNGGGREARSPVPQDEMFI
jgi:methyl-accepting chemotaxis protein